MSMAMRLALAARLAAQDLVEPDRENTPRGILPAAVSARPMPFPYSIANGITFGFMTCTGLKPLTGFAKEMHWIARGVAAILLSKRLAVAGRH